MGSDFQTHSFADLLSNIVDNRGKTCPVVEFGLPLIATNCVKNDTLFPTLDKVRYVDEDTYENWFRGHPEPEDIIFVCKGAPGNVNWTPDPINFCIAQDMVAIRANPEIIDPKYLFALLRSPITQRQILNMHVGTMIPHFKKGDFKNLYFEIPTDKTIQKAIGKIYFDFCEKIELNRQTNETLESMAQALFKSWFVDFDPVIDNALAAGNPIPDVFAERAEQRRKIIANAKKASKAGVPFKGSENDHQTLFPSEFEFTEEMGWIPKGWGGNTVESLIELIGGGTPKTSIEEYWNGTIPWFSVVDAPNSSDIFVTDTEKHVTELGVEKSSTKILPFGTTIISARGTVGKCAMVAKPMAMNQSCYGIRGKDGISDSFVYYLVYLSVATLQQRGHGSVFNTITRDTFKSIHTPFCGKDLTIKFDSLVKSSMNKILENSIQADTLTKLRDTLLPKLLSGELCIPDAEKLIDEMNE